MPSVVTSHSITTWREVATPFSYDSRLFSISFNNHSFLGCRILIINLEKVKPAMDMGNFAKSKPSETNAWFTFTNGTPYNADPVLSSAYKSHMARHTITAGSFGATILGFSRMRYNFTKVSVSGAGVMPESVELRKDAPCRYVEMWLTISSTEADQSSARIDILYNGNHYRYPAFDSTVKHVIPYIITFESGITSPKVVNYNILRVVSVPDNVSSIRLSYYSSKATTFFPKLYYYQLNQN